MTYVAPKHFLMTATVTPQSDMVAIKNPNLRLKQYLDSLKFLCSQNVKRITIIENSGYDFSEEARKISGQISIEYISYKERGNRFSIAQLEALMYVKFFEKTSFLEVDSDIVKVTGRYCFRNLDKFIKKSGNHVFSFRPTLLQKKARSILTCLYQLNLIEFKAWSDFLINENLSAMPLEMHFANFINTRNIKPEFMPYPIIEGYSGSFGTSYSKMHKEKTRIYLSKIIPFGYSWETD
jgi:hypothetical protein